MSNIWKFLYLIPHVEFQEPIEYGPLVLVPHSDPRLLRIAKSSAGVRRLVTKFTNQFEKPMQPSALLSASNTPKSISYYGVTSFRNCIAISGIINASVQKLTGGHAGTASWSDYFDFYPFTVNTNGDLVALSVASMEINRPTNFCGQKTPYLPVQITDVVEYDKEILNRLLSQWSRFFVKNRHELWTRALFRSIEVAYQAMRVPAAGSRTPTIHAIGIGIALWVSALEILAHPRKKKTNLCEVLKLLANAQWIENEVAATRYKVKYQNTIHKVTYVQKLYSDLYFSRNDYLHGNPVTVNKLFPARRTKGPTLLDIAPLIYRAVLDAYLPRMKVKPQRSMTEWLGDALIVRANRKLYEDALLSCRSS